MTGAATDLDRAAGACATLNDPSRLRALKSTDLLAGRSEVLDRLARAASRLVGAPVALVNLVDGDGIHLAGMAGVHGELGAVRRLPCSHAVCDVVVATRAPLVIDDLLNHPIAAERPGVHTLGLRSYLGVPLTTRRGQTLGSFCVLDARIRRWTAEDIENLRDLAEAAVAELELRIGLHERRTRERRFAAFMDHSPVVAALINRDGELEYVNAMFEWHFSVEPSKVIGQQLADLTLPLAAVMIRRCEEVRQRGTSAERTELITSPNGDERQWLVFSFPIEGDGETHVGIVAADLTDRRRLERQLQQAQKLESIGQLAAGIAHELNTPAQYVSDNVRFVAESFESLRWLLQPGRPVCDRSVSSGPCALEQQIEQRLPQETAAFLAEEVPRALEQSLEGLDRIASIVRSIKEFSHPGGKDAVAIDINHTLSLALKMARNEWKYVADCETDFEPSLPAVTCYPGELNLAFLNIVVNASHAMRESGRHGLLRVVTRLDGEHVRICISDTGNGIPAHIRNKVFDPFFTTKPVGTGTGQGLAIAHSVVVEKHGGTIRFDSIEGRGTTFEIRVPISRES